MKKLLSILGASGLVVSTSAVLVSCGSDPQKEDGNNEGEVITENLTLGLHDEGRINVGLYEGFDLKISQPSSYEPPSANFESKYLTAVFNDKTGEVSIKTKGIIADVVLDILKSSKGSSEDESITIKTISLRINNDNQKELSTIITNTELGEMQYPSPMSIEARVKELNDIPEGIKLKASDKTDQMQLFQ